MIDRTFRAGEKFRPVRTESRKMTFLYTDGTDAHFMDTQNYEQMAVPEESVRRVAQVGRCRTRRSRCSTSTSRRATSRCRAPSSWAWPRPSRALRGDTASGGGDKPATLESGVVVRVPLFVNVGDRVRVDTRSGEYVSRA